MRNKFLGTGEAGYHPWRKVRTIFAGLRYSVIYDFSVAWKLSHRWWFWPLRWYFATGSTPS